MPRTGVRDRSPSGSGCRNRPWRACGKAFALQPHRTETWKLSKDPLFIGKVRDIVGLYLHPPDRALVLCVDERSQIQALDRTAPLLPLRPGQPERRRHDYVRHGTTSLFAALDVKADTVIGHCHVRHRALECRTFLDRIQAAVPRDLDVHLILDITRPIRLRAFSAGCCDIPAFTCTLRRPAPRGSISSSGGWWSSRVSRSVGAPIAVLTRCAPPFSSTSMSPTRPRARSSGPKPPTKSSTAWPDFGNGSRNHNTRSRLIIAGIWFKRVGAVTHLAEICWSAYYWFGPIPRGPLTSQGKRGVRLGGRTSRHRRCRPRGSESRLPARPARGGSRAAGAPP